MNKEEKLHRKISKLAYKFYSMRGQKHGYDLEDWLRAEKMIKENRWWLILGSFAVKSINFLGSMALVIFAGATIYYNSRPLVTCTIAGLDQYKKGIYFIIENKSKNIGVSKISYVVISTEERSEEEKTALLTNIVKLSEYKTVLKLYPATQLQVPVMELREVKDHFHLLVLVETPFWFLSERSEVVFYWNKDPNSAFVLQNRYNIKYKETFDKYFKRLKSLQILK